MHFTWNKLWSEWVKRIFHSTHLGPFGEFALYIEFRPIPLKVLLLKLYDGGQILDYKKIWGHWWTHESCYGKSSGYLGTLTTQILFSFLWFPTERPFLPILQNLARTVNQDATLSWQMEHILLGLVPYIQC